MQRNDYFYYIKDKLKSRKDKENEEKRIQGLKELEPELIKEIGKLEEKWSREHVVSDDFDRLIAPSLGLEKKELDNTTRDEHKKMAENKYRDKYVHERDSANKNYNTRSERTQDELEDIYNNESDDLRALSEKYARRKRDERNKTRDKGIGKSSIARLIEDEIEDESSLEADKVKRDSATKAGAKLDILESLREERDNALKDLDVKKAFEIAREMDALAKEQRRKNNEVKAYNNNVDDRERDYALKRQDTIDRIKDRRHQQDLALRRYEYRYGYKPEKEENYRERLDMAIRFYDQMPHGVALESIRKNRELKKLLGLYYNDLLAHQRYRKD